VRKSYTYRQHDKCRILVITVNISFKVYFVFHFRNVYNERNITKKAPEWKRRKEESETCTEGSQNSAL
jgi:hypothetical protein